MSSDSERAADAIQQTLTNFRAQCDDWRHEFDLVMDKLDALPEPHEASDESLGKMISSLTEHQHHVSQRQDDIGQEMAAVHLLVERQVELLDKLVGAPAQRTAAANAD